MHRTTVRFWKCFENIPEHIQVIARQKFQLLKTNPGHPSLHFKQIGKFWSVRVGLAHRALAVEGDKEFIWVWIGSHDEYELILKS